MSPTTTNLAHRAASVNGASVSAQTAAPRVRRGRRPASELSAIRVRVEALMLQGLRSPAIRRALTGPECPNPIVVSERGVRDHMRGVERLWRERTSREAIEADRAKAVAYAEESIRVSFARSTLHAGTNVGVGYFNASLKAQERYARLRGLDAPVREELSGPDGLALQVVVLSDHPADHYSPAEEARRLRQLAADREAEAADDAVDDARPDEAAVGAAQR
jgi:hypothetical protein